jgi:hypothetical protein
MTARERWRRGRRRRAWWRLVFAPRRPSEHGGARRRHDDEACSPRRPPARLGCPLGTPVATRSGRPHSRACAIRVLLRALGHGKARSLSRRPFPPLSTCFGGCRTSSCSPRAFVFGPCVVLGPSCHAVCTPRRGRRYDAWLWPASIPSPFAIRARGLFGWRSWSRWWRICRSPHCPSFCGGSGLTSIEAIHHGIIRMIR